MQQYLIKRLLLIIPTLLGIILLNFIITQFAPGGPVEKIISDIRHSEGSHGDAMQVSGKDSFSRGVEQELVEEFKEKFGFDLPVHERFLNMLGNYLTFDFGESYFRDARVVDLLLEKLPVSISLGLWSTLLIYIISIPLGISKAMRNGSRFDFGTSLIIIIGDAIPAFMFALLLILLFAHGGVFEMFPLRGLTSDNFEELSYWGKIWDYLWHITLPVIALVAGGFAGLTILTKNSFLEEIGKPYVVLARSKGLSWRKVLYNHVFRNSMIIVIAGFPAAFLGIFLTGSLLIEIIFSLDGVGLLGYESIIKRDYAVVFASLYIFTLLGLLVRLLSDLIYVLVDPRIDFERR
jgi:microcin C transport system permease protein